MDEATGAPRRPGPGRPRRARLPAAREVALRDGGRILVRPIRRDDKRRLRDGLARLSAESRYRRFLAPLDELSDELVRQFTEIDYDDHMAWVAIDPSRPGEPGVGVARYMRVPEEPTAAEAAVVVIDEYQGRGIGTILLELLAASAREHGIRSFHAHVLAENTPMVDMLVDLGASVASHGPMLRVEVPIPASPDELPATPTGRVFKLVATDQLPPFRLHLPGSAGR